MSKKQKILSSQNVYADGAEDFLLDFFKNKNESELTSKIDALLADNPSWPIRYHLSPQRHMLLEWYPFKKGSTILEIGAGCGALTGLFLSKAEKVVANELEKNRANVIKSRFSNQSHLVVNSQSIRKFPDNQKFDYVVVIGVLEYAGVFFDNSKRLNSDPHKEFLLKCRSLLKDGGVMLLAIENRLGLKYFSGHPEDHTGVLYDSLNNYSSQSRMKTFSKSEITSLFHSSGFSNIEFYYPFPDYKLPNSIISDQGITEGLNISISELSISPAHNQPYRSLISEPALALSFEQDKVLQHFANSFLIEAKK